MSWIRSSLQSLFHSDWLWPAPVAGVRAMDIEPVRRAMLEALGEDGACLRPLLRERIRHAAGATELWNLRPELMTVASRMHGEREGARRLARVTALFDAGMSHSRRTTRGPSASAFHA